MVNNQIHIKNMEPWLMWLSGLSTGLRTQGSWVQFPVRARAWVVGQVPKWGVQEETDPCFFITSMSLFLFPSLPLSLKVNK